MGRGPRHEAELVAACDALLREVAPATLALHRAGRSLLGEWIRHAAISVVLRVAEGPRSEERARADAERLVADLQTAARTLGPTASVLRALAAAERVELRVNFPPPSGPPRVVRDPAPTAAPA